MRILVINEQTNAGFPKSCFSVKFALTTLPTDPGRGICLRTGLSVRKRILICLLFGFAIQKVPRKVSNFFGYVVDRQEQFRFDCGEGSCTTSAAMEG